MTYQMGQVREALRRSATLLKATKDFIEGNPVAEYEVYFDEAQCDGYCLRDDCVAALEQVEHALALFSDAAPEKHPDTATAGVAI